MSVLGKLPGRHLARLLRIALCVLVAGAFFSAPRPAAAAAPDAKPADAGAVAQARTHFTRGVKLYGEDDFRAALIEFNRAYELAPNWAVLYNVGQSYYQLRDYSNAMTTLEKYVAQGGASIPADRRAQVDREIEELHGRVAHVTIASNVADAEVSVDDVAIGKTPLAAPQLIGAGRHTFRATRQGTVVVTQVVDIAGGDDRTVTLNFVEQLAAPVTPPPVVRPPSYVPAIVTLAVGGAGVITGATFGLFAVGSKSSLDHECHAGACPASAQGDISAYSRNGAISTVGFGVGGAGVVAAAVLFFTERSRGHSAPAPATGVRVSPWLGGTSGGLHGTF